MVKYLLYKMQLIYLIHDDKFNRWQSEKYFAHVKWTLHWQNNIDIIYNWLVKSTRLLFLHRINIKLFYAAVRRLFIQVLN